MAAMSLSALGALVTTNAAAVATAIAGGATTANAQGIGDLLTILGARNDLSQPALLLSVAAKTNLTPG